MNSIQIELVPVLAKDFDIGELLRKRRDVLNKITGVGEQIAHYNVQMGYMIPGSKGEKEINNGLEKLYKARAIYLVAFDGLNEKVMQYYES